MKGISQNEAVGLFAGVVVVVVFFFASRFLPVQTAAEPGSSNQAASVVTLTNSIGEPDLASREVVGAFSADGEVTRLIVEDIKPGTGREVKTGDFILVNYVGNLLDGSTFDSSYNREPFGFTVGAGDVIKGWDEGVVGMKEGGERILIIPAELAYGNRTVGPIPSNSTLLFKIEVVTVR